MTELTTKKCAPCEGGVAPLNAEEIERYLPKIVDWSLSADHSEISRRFKFKNFYATMAFANAVAWLAHQEAHHPELEIGYNYCQVRYSTHAIGGLSENDMICAAKVNALCV